MEIFAPATSFLHCGKFGNSIRSVGAERSRSTDSKQREKKKVFYIYERHEFVTYFPVLGPDGNNRIPTIKMFSEIRLTSFKFCIFLFLIGTRESHGTKNRQFSLLYTEQSKIWNNEQVNNTEMPCFQ